MMSICKIAVKTLPHFEGMELPSYQTPGAAGMDIAAATDRDIILAPGQRELIPTGICIELPIGMEAQIRPRSGLAIKEGVTVLNSPGTIDSDYRGEIKVILINLGEKDFTVSRGMRIAQMVIAPVTQCTLFEAENISGTDRGDGGFGHSGM